MKALGRDSWGLAPALMKDMEEARARGVQVFADQYPYEASSTSLRAALVPGGVEPTDGDRDGEPAAAERARRASSSRRTAPIRRWQGKTLTEIAKARGVDPVTAALALMDGGNASIVSFNMSEPDIEAIMRAPFTMASSDGGLVAVGAGHPASARLRRVRAPAGRLRPRPQRRQPGVRDPLDDEPAGVGLRPQGPRRHPSGRLRRPRHLRSRAPSATPRPTRSRRSSRKASRTCWSTACRSALDGKFTDALPGTCSRK